MGEPVNQVVIVGTGVAGVSAAVGLRAAGYTGTVVLIGNDTELPYRRPSLSKDVVRGERTLDQIRIKQPDWYEEHAIDLQLEAQVTEVDLGRMAVAASDGRSWNYDRLILATGGSARQLGPHCDRVHTLRSAADVLRVAATLTPGGKLVIVGAGLIGSEIAASARAQGTAVTMLEAGDRPLPRILPVELSALYGDLHASNGTELATRVVVTDLTDNGDSVTVAAEDGRSWSGDHVVIAVGMTPNIELADRAGLDIDNGIVVDAAGRTSSPAVYAAGDVANRPEPILGGRIRTEHWQSAMNHGTAVGRAVAGKDTAFDEVPWCWSDQYGVNLQIVGFPDAATTNVTRGDTKSNDFTTLLMRDQQLVAAIGLGRPAEIRAARECIAARGLVQPETLTDDATPLGDLLSAGTA